MNVNVYVLPGPITGEAKVPRVEMIWWFLVSLFFHRIESSAVMLTVFGEKPPLVMLTCFVVAPSAVGATASSPTTTLKTSSKRVRIADLLVADRSCRCKHSPVRRGSNES